MMNLIAQSFIIITISTLLLLIDPKIAMIVGLSLLIVYGIIYKFIRGILHRLGLERVKANQMRFTAVNEAFGSIKEVKVSSLENTRIKKFAEPAKALARLVASTNILSHVPRFAIEAIAFGGMLLAILFHMSNNGTFNNILPIIVVYAFAGYRLIPAIQQIYVSITYLRAVSPSLDLLNKDMKNLENINTDLALEPLKLNKNIKLKNVFYNYPNTSRTALKDISITITANTSVAFVGETGSGKTTAIDLILGLLEPQKGTLEIDDQIIDKSNLRAWQKSIGYVPQNIYLSDETIAENIAFELKKLIKKLLNMLLKFHK